MFPLKILHNINDNSVPRNPTIEMVNVMVKLYLLMSEMSLYEMTLLHNTSL